VNEKREADFVRIVLATREHLKSVYARSNDSPAALRHEKLLAIEQLREEHAKLKQEEWGGYSGYDGWFKRPINNAQLNTIATYHRFVPSFRALLRANEGDLEKFYEQVELLGKLPKKARHRRLLEKAQTTQQLPGAVISRGSVVSRRVGAVPLCSCDLGTNEGSTKMEPPILAMTHGALSTKP
jgi:predicted aminopeptidase